MVCKKCNESGKLCEVLSKHYYYCQTCKVEIELETAPAKYTYTYGLSGDSTGYPPISLEEYLAAGMQAALDSLNGAVKDLP